MSEYVPPTVWEWKQGNGGRFANINRPIAGATHEKELQEKKRQECNNLVAAIATLNPDTPYDKLPLNRQLQLQNGCGIPIH